jgi:predicted RNase H-like nuclease
VHVLLCGDNLAKRRKVEDASCLFCLEPETVQHILFECVVAKQCWLVISNATGCRLGENIVEKIGKYWLSDKKHCLTNIISSAVIWSIWKLRNELCFQRIG